MENYRTEHVPDPDSSDEGRSGTKRIIIDIIETLLISVVLFVGINFVSARIRVDGFSMEPTMHSGEFVIVNKLAYVFSEPSLGDVIVFQYPGDPEQEYIKRVIGTSGDKVVIQDGLVFLNGEVIDEPYIAAPPAYQTDWIVPEDSLFVLGDNRNNSSDSHSWGTVPMDFVIGKAIFVYWPPESWGVIEHVSAASPQQ